MVTGPTAGYQLLRADANGDGIPDIIAYFAQINVLLNDGHGNMHLASSSSPVDGILTLRAADLNRDGHVDLVGCYIGLADGPQQLGFWFNDGTGKFSLGSSPSVPGDCHAIAMGDYNADGIPDLAVAWIVKDSTGGFYNGLSVFFGTSNGQFSSPEVTDHFTLMSESGACSIARMVSADYDRDGRADLAIGTGCPAGDSSNSVLVYGHGDGSGHFAFSNIAEAYRDIYPQRDDVDQDGIFDIPFYNAGSGPHASGAFEFGWFRNTNGTNPPSWDSRTVYSQGYYDGSGNSLQGGVFADFDGDGRKDAALTESYNDDCCGNPPAYWFDLFRQQSNGTFIGPQKITLSSRGGEMITGDFNRDGRMDAAFASNSGTVLMLNTTASAPGCSADSVVRTVKICTPAQLNSNNLHLFANTTDSDNITGMRAYLDNSFKFYTPNDLMNKYVTVPNGGHRITIRAWDARGSFSSARWINVNTSFGCPTLSTNRTINLCFPTSSATVGSPMQVVAAVRTSYTYKGAKVYIDGVSKYSTTSKQVNANLSLPAGTHRVTVQAIDSHGTISKTVYATVR
jgi:hypothetical protein